MRSNIAVNLVSAVRRNLKHHETYFNLSKDCALCQSSTENSKPQTIRLA